MFLGDVILNGKLLCNTKWYVILNGKFRSFLVRILIQKDNTDNKVLKRNFIQKKQEKDRKDKASQTLV